jgi:small-conductance mechanosensitive channel
VVVGSDEGYARKISVRSTEVETPERARILIPNSYLVTEKVKNWTLRDNIRRSAAFRNARFRAWSPARICAEMANLRHE